MATFWVGQSGIHTRTAFISPEKWAEIDGGPPRIYLAFRFANKNRKALRIGQRTLEGENSKFTFNVPHDFFTDDLKGPCQTQLVVTTTLTRPAIAFPIQNDEVVSAMIMSLEELQTQ